MGTPSGLGNCWRGPSVPLVASGGLFLALLVATADAFGAPPLPDTQPAVVAAAPDGDLVARGRSLFVAKGCVACHSIAGVPGSAQVGPNLTALPSVAPLRQPGLAAADYVRESLVSPQAYVVPGYAANPASPGSPAMPKLALTGDEIDALIAFLLSPR